MQRRYLVLFLLVALFLSVPCAAFAINALTIDGGSYDTVALAGDLSGPGWSWQGSAKGGQGELKLNGYNGGSIESTDGVLNIRLSGENIITTNALNMLYVHGNNTGLNIYGSNATADKLITRSNIVVNTPYPTISGIRVAISNSTTIPVSCSNISYVLDVSQATTTEWVPGLDYPYSIYGINIAQTVINASILGIDMQMDNAIFEMSNGSSGGTFSYGMWANPYYSAIQAVFSSCIFNLSDFASRGWYTGRDFAVSSKATYNNCLFNMHTSSTVAIGVHLSSDDDHGFGVSKLVFNNPSGEIETLGSVAVYARGSHPTLTVNGSEIQAWQADGTEIADPKIVTIFTDAAHTSIVSKSVGVADAVYSNPNYDDQLAVHVIFTVIPVQIPLTGDTSTPVLYGILFLLAAAGLMLLRVRTVR